MTLLGLNFPPATYMWDEAEFARRKMQLYLPVKILYLQGQAWNGREGRYSNIYNKNVIYPELVTPTGVSIDDFEVSNGHLDENMKLITSDCFD